MPYTPPSRSPSASPSSSRSSSFSVNQDARTQSTMNLLGKSNPPRSASYMHKHRRSSSVSSSAVGNMQHYFPPASQMPNPPTVKDPRLSESLHQSPPPVDGGLSIIPTGAVISPPDSDEEDGGVRRGRDLGQLEDELKEAIKKIPQRRIPSPDPVALEHLAQPIDSTAAQRRGHHRTASEPLIDVVFRTPRSSRSASVSDIDDDGPLVAPPMVRKKSGELVKSSLKSPSRSRPISVPSTPTFPKNVHFDARIEHVRHFLHSEMPSAVSAGSSPVEHAYDGEGEYPFGDGDTRGWQITLPNFPKDLEARRHMPVRLEKIFLSTDQKNLIGTVVVANLAYQKLVVARFTFDYWQTVSEVTAEWTADVRKKEREEGVDHFIFKIKLADQANLEGKTLYICIRYRAAGQEHWDNNYGLNFEVNFKTKQRVTKNAGPRQVPLPRSKPSFSASRPRSMPNMDDYSVFDDAFLERAKELDIRAKDERTSSRSKSTTKEDAALLARRTNPSGNAFGNRYDFGVSLNAAIKAAQTSTGPKNRPDQSSAPGSQQQLGSYFEIPVSDIKPSTLDASTTPMDSPSTTGAGRPEVLKVDSEPEVSPSEKPSIGSLYYRELLDNYCFFGTPKAASKFSHKDAAEEALLKDPVKSVPVPLVQLAVVPEKPPSPNYTYTTLGQASPPALSLAQQIGAGNASPIPVNYAGYRHRRRGSGAFRFEATTATAIC